RAVAAGGQQNDFAVGVDGFHAVDVEFAGMRAVETILIYGIAVLVERGIDVVDGLGSHRCGRAAVQFVPRNGPLHRLRTRSGAGVDAHRVALYLRAAVVVENDAFGRVRIAFFVRREELDAVVARAVSGCVG